MAEEIPLRPLGKQDIHKLETALLIATLLRPDVIEEIRKAEERLTWVDSLAVAAAALARSKAGYTVTMIADELGRSEGTIRNHLTGKTKAGKLVQETYQRFLREGVKIEIPEVVAKITPEEVYKKEIEKLEKELEELRSAKTELEGKVKSLEEKVKNLENEKTNLETEVAKYKQKIEEIKRIVSSI
ncbi:MAG: transcriptional regulator [Desulfurococcales archaeon ex4484_217_2]|nr:MAG: transcriptional regulator [Desulfurococcales archaeon ex4484_217_2]